MNHPSIDLIFHALTYPVARVVSPRYIFQDIFWAPEILPEVDLKMLGFSPPAKMRQLVRNYYDADRAAAVADLIRARRGKAFTSVSLSMRAGAKDARSQGWCMEAIVFRRVGVKDVTATVLYRSTEIVQKFSADLAFIPWIYDQMGIKVTRTNFFFANAYVSGVFLPAIFRHHAPVTFLRRVRKVNPEFYKLIAEYFTRHYQDRESFSTYSPKRKQQQMGWDLIPERMEQALRFMETTR